MQEVEQQPIVKSEPVAHHYQVPEQSVATYQEGEAGYGEEDYGAYEDESAYDGAVQLTDTTKGKNILPTLLCALRKPILLRSGRGFCRDLKHRKSLLLVPILQLSVWWRWL